MTAPARTVSSLIRSAVAVPGARAELIRKMIFIKVGPCCETPRYAAVNMPKMRTNGGENVLNSGRRRAVHGLSWTDPNSSTVSLCNANFRRVRLGEATYMNRRGRGTR
jgi:hypothetical protein